MSNYNQVTASGDGTRPSTSGGVDNMGAGEKLSTKRDAAGSEVGGGPAPHERMQNKRKDVAGTKVDDSAAYELHEDLTPEPNREDGKPPQVTGAKP